MTLNEQTTRYYSDAATKIRTRVITVSDNQSPNNDSIPNDIAPIIPKKPVNPIIFGSEEDNQSPNNDSIPNDIAPIIPKKSVNPIIFGSEEDNQSPNNDSISNDIAPTIPKRSVNPIILEENKINNNKDMNPINVSNNIFSSDILFTLDTKGHLQFSYQNSLLELSNFYVTPLKIIISDNGLFLETSYVLRCVLENEFEEKDIFISSYALCKSEWLTQKLGIKYYIAASTNAYKLFRIYLSKQFKYIKPEFKYTLVGWKCINNKYVYLNGNGAIGSSDKNLKGSLDKIIEIDSKMTSYYSLEESLSLLNLSDSLEKTLPLFLYSHLAVMKEVFTLAEVEPHFLLWVYGLTGTMKTSVCKIFFNLYNRQSKPIISATFKDTAAAVEIKAFEFKDSVLLLDDYHPTTSSTEKKAMETLASHVLRMYGDGITRSRATKTMGKQKEFLPRGLCVLTGEDKLGGESTVARYIGIEVSANDYHTNILTYHQENPLIYSTHMFHFINWVSNNFEEIITLIKTSFKEYRKNPNHSFKHKRLNDSYAILQITANLLLRYSVQIGYLDPLNVNTKFNEWSDTLLQVIMTHEQANVEENPAIMYLTALEELISSRKCILLSKDETCNNKSNVLGYKDDELYYLLPETSFAYVRSFWKNQGQEFPVSKDQVNKALDNLGIIKTKKEGIQIKRTIKVVLGKQPRKRYLIIDIKRMAELLNNL